MTVDLSSAPLSRTRKRSVPQSTPGTAATNQSEENGDGGSNQTPAAAEDNVDSSLIDPELDNGHKLVSDLQDRIQILDLHTANPVISYQNQIYSCQWTDTIGTDILLTPPDSAIPIPPEHRYPGFAIQAMTRVKLVGQPVQLIPRVEALSANQSVPSEETSAISTTAIPTASEESSSTPARPVPPQSQQFHPRTRIPIKPSDSRSRQNQARFLERLMEAKASKGETDSVTVYSKRRITGTGWRSWGRKDAEDAEDAEEDQDKAEEGGDQRAEGEEHREEGAVDQLDDEASSVTPGPMRARSESEGTPKSQPSAPARTPKRLGRPPGKRNRTNEPVAGGLFRDYVRGAGGGARSDILGSDPEENVEGQRASVEDEAGIVRAGGDMDVEDTRAHTTGTNAGDTVERNNERQVGDEDTGMEDAG